MANRNSSKELYIYIRICAELQKYITLQYEFVCFGCLLCSTEFATTFDRVTLNDTSNSFENGPQFTEYFQLLPAQPF